MEQLSGGGRHAAWRAGFQRKYLSRLVDVLRRGRIKCVTSVSARSRAVKLAADLSLAMTARDRSTWSRYILGKFIFRLKKTRCETRAIKSHAKRISASQKRTMPCRKSVRWLLGRASRARTSTFRSSHNCEEEAGGTVASRMQTLRLLVPGSRGLDTPVFLKEATDYIVALKMQVQAMQALADCCSNSTGLDIASQGPISILSRDRIL